jgi:hypothetical protein
MLISRLCCGGAFIVLCHSALTTKTLGGSSQPDRNFTRFLKGVRVILILGCVVIIVIIVIVGMLLAGEVDYHLPPRARLRNLEEP